MRFRVAYRESSTAPMGVVEVPHLDPIRHAVEAGRDGFVRLPDGRRIRPSAIVSIAEVDEEGRTRRAWEVRAGGLDGAHDWTQAWRAVAAATAGIAADDPRTPALTAALDALEDAWRQRHALAWQAARARFDRARRDAREVA